MVITNIELLGETLQKAGLISHSQIQVALVDRQYNQDLRLGEILAIRGWIEAKTADFFADEWQFIRRQQDKYPLGYYLEKSGLLTKGQIDSILQEQKQIWLKFGSVAVLQGLLKENTLDFFLDNLFPAKSSELPHIGKKNNFMKNNSSTDKTQIIVQTNEVKTDIDYDDIPWID